MERFLENLLLLVKQKKYFQLTHPLTKWFVAQKEKAFPNYVDSNENYHKIHLTGKIFKNHFPSKNTNTETTESKKVI